MKERFYAPLGRLGGYLLASLPKLGRVRRTHSEAEVELTEERGAWVKSFVTLL